MNILGMKHSVEMRRRDLRPSTPRRTVTRWAAIVVAFLSFGIVASCGGGYGSNNGGGSGGGSGGGLSASITNSVTSIQAGVMYTFQATTPSSNGYSSGITWSISPATGAGSLTNVVDSGYSSSVVYTAPSAAPNPNSVTITATPSDTRVASAKDTFTITVPAMGMLKGQFAFELSGSDSTGDTVAAIGSVMADGAGKITGGAMDLYRHSAPAAHVASIGGSYTVDATMHGAISLASASGTDGPLGFTFVLAADEQSGEITGSDARGSRISGLMIRQDAAAFSLGKIASDFVFKLESNAGDRLATVGRFTIDNNGMLRGIADQSKSGVGSVFEAAAITGHLTALPDGNGRGTCVLGTAAANAPFVFYVGSASRLFLLEFDSGRFAGARQLGRADHQALPFSGTSANISAAIRGSGFDTRPSSPGYVSVKGTLAIPNSTNATLSWDAVSAGSTVSIDSLRSDLVTFNPSTGRGTIEIANGAANNFADSVAFYLAGPGGGFFLDSSSGRLNRAIAGDLESAK